MLYVVKLIISITSNKKFDHISSRSRTAAQAHGTIACVKMQYILIQTSYYSITI
jgi:hypothetical protein